MNLTRLKYFVKIVDVGSLTQAADVLHIAQPALSQQLATLEGEMKQQLLIRSKRGVTPTDAGKILYAHAQLILRQCEQAQSDVQTASEALSGKVSVGLAPGTAASALALPLLRTVRERYPGIMLYLNENFGTTLSELIMNGRMDMAVLYGNQSIHGLRFRPLFKEQLYLVSPPSCPLPAAGIALNEAAQHALMLPRQYNAIRQYVDGACLKLGIHPHVIAEVESLSTLTDALVDELGATVLPGSIAHLLAATTSAHVSPIIAPIIEAPLALCLSTHLPLSIPAQAVMNILLELVDTVPHIEAASVTAAAS